MSSDVELVSLPTRLRAARQAVGLSRAPVARALRIPVSRLARWERGQTRVPLSAVLRLADLYGCGVGFLLTGRTPRGVRAARLVALPAPSLPVEAAAELACVRVHLARVDAALRTREA